jgi:ABC-2 type transport system permease protein
LFRPGDTFSKSHREKIKRRIMLRLRSSVVKEMLVLIRDKAGLAILFIMPMVLIFVMTLIQDTTFRKLDETNLQILVVNDDQDSLGAAIEKGLSLSDFFSVVTEIGGKKIAEEELIRNLSEGNYQIGIVIREGTTGALREKAKTLIETALAATGSEEKLSEPEDRTAAKIMVYFDPVIQNSFKQSMMNALDNYTSKLESKIIFESFAQEVEPLLPEESDLSFIGETGLRIEEAYAFNEYNEVLPNTVQHNVPAWTVFAMFFIIIPLTGNIIKERENGTVLRLKLMPGTYFTVLFSKIIVYIAVCLIQFVLMLTVGMVFLPMMGLPALELGAHPGALILLAVTVGLAATGYGVLLGTVATSHEQAASFGSVSVIILAAIGGIWVPVYMMPAVMQKISIISPLNWGLDGFYDLFLRGANVTDILLPALYLLAFFVGTMLMAFQYERMKKSLI